LTEARPTRGPSGIIDAYPIPIAALATVAIVLVFAFSFVIAPKGVRATNPNEVKLLLPDMEPDKSPAPLTAEVSSAFVETNSARAEAPPPPAPEPEPAPPAKLASSPQKYTPVSRDGLVTKGKMTSTLTFYDCLGQGFCGAMANGRKVHEGAAACSYNMAMGTMFTITGDPTNRVYVCEDRGMLPNTHVDIFWNDPKDGYWWQGQVGMRGTLEIVELK
jgi:hypothetical protein